MGITTLLAAAPALASSSAGLQICRNFATSPPRTLNCTGNGSGSEGWDPSTASYPQAIYRMGDFVPIRALFNGLTTNTTYTLRIRYAAMHGSDHLFDYLGTYDASRRTGQTIDPCSTVGPGSSFPQVTGEVVTAGPHACDSAASTEAVPVDQNTTFATPSGPPPARPPLADACAGGPCVFSAWGAELLSASFVSEAPASEDCSSGPIPRTSGGGFLYRCIDLTFRAEGTGVVIAWAGHIAGPANWPPGSLTASGALWKMYLLHLTDNANNTEVTGERTVSVQPVKAPGFYTSVTVAQPCVPPPPAGSVGLVNEGCRVFDTAHLSSPTDGPGVPPTGSVRFFVCFSETPLPAGCPPGGPGEAPAGHVEQMTVTGARTSTATILYPPEAATPLMQLGFYCFRAEYFPLDVSPFEPATHTNATVGGAMGECFQVIRPPATLRVNKVCEPPGHFNLHIRGVTVDGQTVDETFPNVPCNGGDEIEVPAGTYTVSESTGMDTNPADFDPPEFGSACANGSVTLAAGQRVTCTITNFRPGEPRASLTVEKRCNPTNDTGVFVVLIGTLRYELGCGENTGTIDLPTGRHTVTEEAGPNTTLSDYHTTFSGVCQANGGSRTASVDLTANVSVTCTITNTRHVPATAVLTVHKECQPANDNGRFVLDINEHEFPGIGCGHGTGPVTLAPGTHLVGEVAANNYETRIGGDCAADGTITLRAGQHASCTVTNIRIEHPQAPIRPKPKPKPKPKKPKPKAKPPSFTG